MAESPDNEQKTLGGLVLLNCVHVLIIIFLSRNLTLFYLVSKRGQEEEEESGQSEAEEQDQHREDARCLLSARGPVCNLWWASPTSSIFISNVVTPGLRGWWHWTVWNKIVCLLIDLYRKAIQALKERQDQGQWLTTGSGWWPECRLWSAAVDRHPVTKSDSSPVSKGCVYRWFGPDPWTVDWKWKSQRVLTGRPANSCNLWSYMNKM